MEEARARRNLEMMAEARADDDDVFVYMGGDQQVPLGVRRAKIHISVKKVLRRAFYNRRRLISVEFHDGIEIIEEEAFCNCQLFRGRIKLLGVKIIKVQAFWCCYGLMGVEFGDKLETIERGAFYNTALKKIKMPSVRTIGQGAFTGCCGLSDVECGEALRKLQENAFHQCPKLKRIALPLQDDMIEDDVFNECPNLTTVDLVGGIHHTVASLHLESWRSEMNNEIDRINQVLPTFTASHKTQKTGEIQRWIRSTFRQLDYYKSEHLQLLKEATALLELALWKANLDDNGGGEREGVRTTRGSRKRARKEICVTSGASIVIKNVLPFLQLIEYVT